MYRVKIIIDEGIINIFDVKLLAIRKSIRLKISIDL